MFYKFFRHKTIFLILILGFLVRIWNIESPFFTPDEAQIVSRGYFLANQSTDELGRKFPWLFNGSNDYELPVVSYLTAVGVKLLGKNDLGSRISFILLGVFWIYLLIKLSQELFKDKFTSHIIGLIAAFSSGAIFLSKIPNNIIFSWVLLTILCYLFVRRKNIILIIVTLLLLLLTSKVFWFIILPFIFISLLFRDRNQIFKEKSNLVLLGVSLGLTIFCFTFFLNIPQSIRSLAENNFTLFTNSDNQTSINVLRGHGLKAGVPADIEKLLFNKLSLVGLGVVHLLDHLNPLNYFGNTHDGSYNFANFGFLPKSGIILFLIGIYSIIRKKRDVFLLLGIVLVSSTSFLIYPGISTPILLLSVPFLFLIMAEGIKNVPKYVSLIIFSLVILESLLLFGSSDIEAKKPDGVRSSWIKPITEDVYDRSLKNKSYISDDIVDGFGYYLVWLSDYKYINPSDSLIKYPYKYNLELGNNISYLHQDSIFKSCFLENGELIMKSSAFVSPRDYKRVSSLVTEELLKQSTSKIYYDSKGHIQGYLVENILCL